MIVLAWVLAVLFVLVIIGLVVIAALDDPEMFFALIACGVVTVILSGGIWGIGFINGAWGPLW